MKNFLDLCTQRYSVRKYKDTPIPHEVLKYIQACTRLAPSAVNRQPWKFYLIREASTLEQLYPCYDRTWFREAPICVVACKLTDEEWKREADQKPHGDIDVAIAVEHLCLAAAEKGIGTCWVCNFDVERCRKVLDLPYGIIPVALIPMGYSADESTQQKSERKSRKLGKNAKNPSENLRARPQHLLRASRRIFFGRNGQRAALCRTLQSLITFHASPKALERILTGNSATQHDFILALRNLIVAHLLRYYVIGLPRHSIIDSPVKPHTLRGTADRNTAHPTSFHFG